MVLYDVNRSKYVMLTKKRKREMLEVSPSKERVLKRLWMLWVISAVLLMVTWLMESLYTDVLFSIFGSLATGRLSPCYGYRHREKYFTFWCKRVIFIFILLGMNFYVNTTLS